MHELAKARSGIQEEPGMPKEFLEDERYYIKYIISVSKGYYCLLFFPSSKLQTETFDRKHNQELNSVFLNF